MMKVHLHQRVWGCSVEEILFSDENSLRDDDDDDDDQMTTTVEICEAF